MGDAPVMAIAKWASNADLIADCARLGYLHKDWLTLDPTYGYGTFWKLWQPKELVASDLATGGYDFRHLPYVDRWFKAVVLDPPYKLNGTPTKVVDERYGVHEPTDWRSRMDLIRLGIGECCRVSEDYLLLKCQDQVCSGKVRWQTIEFTNYAATCGFGLVDRLDFLSYRPQPEGRTQVHARRNASTLLVFRRGWQS